VCAVIGKVFTNSAIKSTFKKHYPPRAVFSNWLQSFQT